MKISIITPSYNQSAFIERTIQSVQIQAHSGLSIEHIVFDACSADETIDILRNYESSIHWKSEADEGQADAVNKGFSIASGEIIGWLNSDDTYEPGAVECVAEFFKNNPDVDIVYGEANHIDVNDNHIEVYPTKDWDPESLKQTCFICQPSVFFRRQILDEYGNLDAKLQYCMDYEFWLRLAKSGKEFVKIDRILANSRLYDDNKTLGSRLKVHHEICLMFRNLHGMVPDKWLFNYAHAKVDDFKLSNSLYRLAAIIFFSCTSSIYWNRAISFDMMRQMFLWCKNALKD